MTRLGRRIKAEAFEWPDRRERDFRFPRKRSARTIERQLRLEMLIAANANATCCMKGVNQHKSVRQIERRRFAPPVAKNRKGEWFVKAGPHAVARADEIRTPKRDRPEAGRDANPSPGQRIAASECWRGPNLMRGGSIKNELLI
jgi:hypothetical protein